MLFRRPAGLTAGLLCLAVLGAAPPALASGPANVTVRIEGAANTLREEGALRTTPDPVAKGGNPPCTGTSAAGAPFPVPATAVKPSWSRARLSLPRPSSAVKSTTTADSSPCGS